MPTFKVFPNKLKLNKNGEAPIYMRLIKDRKPTYLSLGYHIKLEDWDFEKSRVKKSHPNSARMNNYIAQKLAEAQGHALELEGKEKGINSKSIKKAVIGQVSQSFLNMLTSILKNCATKPKLEHWIKQRQSLENSRPTLEPMTYYLRK
ncbi:MAG: hypothetical protein IPI65_16905 [Bacteroidetes bacterium]|nr:hypothetical protein [Bacteroidota bacterium]